MEFNYHVTGRERAVTGFQEGTSITSINVSELLDRLWTRELVFRNLLTEDGSSMDVVALQEERLASEREIIEKLVDRALDA